MRLAQRIGADAICEKPLVINPWNLEPLVELQEEHGRRPEIGVLHYDGCVLPRQMQYQGQVIAFGGGLSQSLAGRSATREHYAIDLWVRPQLEADPIIALHHIEDTGR